MRPFCILALSLLALGLASPAAAGPITPSATPPGLDGTPPPPPAWAGGTPPPECRLKVTLSPPPSGDGTTPLDATGTYVIYGEVAYERLDYPNLADGHLRYAYVEVKLYERSGNGFIPQGTKITATNSNGWFGVTYYTQPTDPYLEVLVYLYEVGGFRMMSAGDWVTFGTGLIQGTPGGGTTLQLKEEGSELVWSCHAYTVIQSARDFFETMGYPLPFTEFQLSDESVVTASSIVRLDPALSAHEGAVVWVLAEQWLLNYSILDDRVCPECLEDPSLCSSRLGCETDPVQAWTNGFAFWLADQVPRLYASDFQNYPSVLAFDAESAPSCTSGTGNLADTPGGFAAVLRDVTDSEQDETGYLGWGVDLLDESPQDVLGIAVSISPPGPRTYLRALQARLGTTPVIFWRTAINSRVDIDLELPGFATNLVSTSHEINVVSPDATIDMTWTAATDDYSGVVGYSIRWGDSPAMPDTIADIGHGLTRATVGPVTSGTRWISVRAVDRAGKWSETAAFAGPYIVDIPEPADVEAYQPSGWDYAAIPRPTADATAHICTAPTSLTGNSLSTYWNFCGRNTGDETTSKTSVVEGFIDGVSIGTDPIPKIDPSIIYTGLNLGPIQVRGGRHTLEVFHDATEVMAENDETDNRWAHQWVWSPRVLTAGVALTRSAPPHPTAGHASIVDGSWVAPNCDGFRFATSGNWNALTVHATAGDDYTARLYAASTGPSGGFVLPSASSERPAGYLQGFIANRAVTGLVNYDVGVMNDSDGSGTGTFRIRHVTSVAQTWGASATVPLADGEVLTLRECSITASAATITIDVDPPTQAMHALWFEPTFAKGALVGSGLVPWDTDANGRIRFSVSLPTTGSYALAVFRDPRDGTAPATLTITVEAARPDFQPTTPSGWPAPLVPGNAPIVPPPIVVLPDTLYGGVSTTYMNLAVINGGLGSAYPSMHNVYLDGAELATMFTSSLPAQSTQALLGTESLAIPGGRHTLSIVLDDDDSVDETCETNNTFAEQFVWGPLQLAAGTPVARSAPPAVNGGWNHAGNPASFGLNCDGFRMPASASRFSAVAATGTDTSNVTLRFHAPASGILDGFDEALAESGWGPGRSDLLLLNRDVAGPGVIDVSVVRITGTQGYRIEAVDASELSFDGDDTYGPFTLGTGHLLHLYDVDLAAGPLVVQLVNVSGTIDWGLSIHPADRGHVAKSEALDNGLAWVAAAGEGEALATWIPAPGHYAIAVWKATSTAVGAAGSYTLHLGTNVVSAPEESPTISLIAAVRPNPFGARTAIRLELARPGPVAVDVVDLRGTLVRRVLAEDLPAGIREVIWDGRDDLGRPVAAGTYLVHVAAAGSEATRKVVMIR